MQNYLKRKYRISSQNNNYAVELITFLDPSSLFHTVLISYFHVNLTNLQVNQFKTYFSIQLFIFT